MWLVYRRRLPPALPAEALDERGALHHALMIKTMAAVAVMLVAFLAGCRSRWWPSAAPPTVSSRGG